LDDVSLPFLIKLIRFDNGNRNLGYLLHPTVLKAASPQCRIADIGAGSCAWLLELATSLPESLQLDAFDISAEQFPVASTLPSNISLHTADVKLPFPVELHEKYDIIHLRLLVCALEKDDWELVTRNCLKLLKPGGIIQWDEGDHFNSKQVRGSDPESTVTSLRKAANKFALDCSHRLKYGWSTLPQIFRDIGLEGVETDVVSIDRIPETREAWTINGMLGIFGWLRLAAKGGGEGVWSLEEVERCEEGVRRDIRGGGYSRFEIYVTWGRKGV
jgi:SAM-dependent methyltransferase